MEDIINEIKEYQKQIKFFQDIYSDDRKLFEAVNSLKNNPKASSSSPNPASIRRLTFRQKEINPISIISSIIWTATLKIRPNTFGSPTKIV